MAEKPGWIKGKAKGEEPEGKEKEAVKEAEGKGKRRASVLYDRKDKDRG